MKDVARELRNNSGEIMRQLDHCESFVVSRNGIRFGELSPLRRHRFISAAAAVAAFRGALRVELDRFRADLDGLPARRSRLMSEAPHPSRGLVDTSVVIDLDLVDAEQLPNELAISALTIAELAAGPHATGDAGERAQGQDRLQRAEATSTRYIRCRLGQSVRTHLRAAMRHGRWTFRSMRRSRWLLAPPSTAGHRGETAMAFFWRTNPTTWRLRVGPVFPVPRRVAATKI